MSNFFKKNIFNNPKKAFTLVEVMLGLAMLGIVFLAITTLFISSLRANKANLHSLTAYNLAQEGLELFRNGRDSNWLQNYGWLGTAGFSAPLDVISSLAEVGDYTYLVMALDISASSDFGIQAKDLGPLISEALVQARKEIWLCDIRDNLSPVGIYSVNNFAADDSCEAFDAGSLLSPYRRFLRVDVLEKDLANQIVKVRVTATVLWKEPWNQAGDLSRVDLSAELTDWKGGPL